MAKCSFRARFLKEPTRKEKSRASRDLQIRATRQPARSGNSIRVWSRGASSTCLLTICWSNGRKPFPTHWESLDWLEKAGFRVNPHRKLCKTIDEVIEFANEKEALRDELGYEIDGLVVKVNSTALQDEFGATSESAALGHRLQVSRAPGVDKSSGHRGPGGTHRRANARRQSGTGVSRRHDCLARHACTTKMRSSVWE